MSLPPEKVDLRLKCKATSLDLLAILKIINILPIKECTFLKHQCLTHLVVAEHVLLPEGEEDDVAVVGRVLDRLLLCAVLQHAGRLVDDPVGTEEGQQQLAARLHQVHRHVHRQLGVRVAGEAQGEELGHALVDAQVAVPLAALVLDEHQLHDLAADPGVEHVRAAALQQLVELSGALEDGGALDPS